jgi:hypothetical protein
MEIHPLHGPIRSFREFLIHLLTITVGVLIALSLDGILEWRHHRHLVHEAESNLMTEIHLNREGLGQGLIQMDTTMVQLRRIHHSILQLLDNKPIALENLNLEASITTLQSAAWSTASGTGALSLMDYSEVEHYASVYDLQQVFGTLQQHSQDAIMELESYSALLHIDPKQVPLTEYIEAVRAVGRSLAAVKATSDVGQALMNQYASMP